MPAPQRPAAVSGPGALSRRTDGGAGNSKQPIRVASGGNYGDRQKMEQQQAGAPMAAGGSPAAGGPAGAQGGPLPPVDVFGPTQRPNEPMTAGMEQSGLYSPEDPYLPIRIMYQMYPHPSLARLLPEE